MKKQAALLAITCLAVSPAWAVNKCTMLDGTAALQDLPLQRGQLQVAIGQ